MRLILKLMLSIMLCTIVVNASESAPTKEEVAKLYVATFNRAPDSAGLSYWVDDSGLSLSQIAQSFFEQQETQNLYPQGTSNGSFIDSVYQNLFNRNPDSGGYDYWKDELDRGVAQRDYFILMVINGAKDTDTSKDKTILENKTKVTLSYIKELGNKTNITNPNAENGPAYIASKKILSGVTEDTATVDEAISYIETIKNYIDPIGKINIDWNPLTASNAYEIPNQISFDTNISLPTNNLDIKPSSLRVSSFISDTQEITDNEAQIVMAEDENNRTILLGYAIPPSTLRSSGILHSSIVARVASIEQVEISIRSTALALVMLNISTSIDENIKTELANIVLQDSDFETLVSDINTTFAANPYLLDELMTHQEIVDQIKKIAKNSLVNYVKSLDNSLDATQAENLFDINSLSDPYSISSDITFRAVVGQRIEDSFWFKSPWKSSEPWLWYWGGNPIYNILDAPFLSTSQSTSGLIAVGNPTHINYIMETYDDSGDMIDWYIVPRCSTLIQKTLYSGAAYRDMQFMSMHSDKQVAFIEMHKYLIDGEWNSRHYGVLALNTLHLVSGIIGAISDASLINSVAKNIVEKKDLFYKIIIAGKDLAKVMISMASTVDYSKSSSAGEFLANNFTSISEVVVNELFASVAPDVEKSISKMLAKAGLKTSNPLGWAMIVADSINDFIPFSVSLLAADSYAGYAVTHDTTSILDVTRTDRRPDGTSNQDVGTTMPIAMFTVKQSNGLSIEFDASASQFDTNANPSYEWGFGDGTTDSGKIVTHAYDKVGIYDVELRVYDGLGNSHTVDAQVTVKNGTPPVINSLTCNIKDDLGASGKTLWLTYDVTDADNDINLVKIYEVGSTSPDKTITFDGNEAFYYFDTPTPTNRYAVKVEFTDDGGNIAQTTCTAYDDNVKWIQVGGTIQSDNKSITSTQIKLAGNKPLVVYGGDPRNFAIGNVKYLNSSNIWQFLGTDTLTEYRISNYYGIDMAISKNDVPYVAYTYWDAIQHLVYIKIKRYINGTWELVGNALPQEYQVLNINIKFSNDNIPYIAYRTRKKDDDGNIKYALEIQKLNNTKWEMLASKRFGGNNYRGFSGTKLKIINNTPYVAMANDLNLETYENFDRHINVYRLDIDTLTEIGSDLGTFTSMAGYRIAFCSYNNQPIIAFEDYYKHMIHVLQYKDNLWKEIGSPLISGENPCFATYNNALYMAYTDRTTANVKILKYQNSIWTIINGTNNIYGKYGSDDVSIAFDTNGYLYVTSTDDSTANKNYVYRIDKPE